MISRRARRLVLAASVLMVVTGGLSSCGSDPKPKSTATPSPTATTPAWASEYTPEQLAAYDSSLAFWNKFLGVLQPVWAQGQATPEACAKLAPYQNNAQAEIRCQELHNMQDGRYKFTKLPPVLWEKPVTISIVGGESTVTFERCIDPPRAVASQNGVQVTPMTDHPVLDKVTIDTYKDGSQYISDWSEPGDTCSADS